MPRIPTLGVHQILLFVFLVCWGFAVGLGVFIGDTDELEAFSSACYPQFKKKFQICCVFFESDFSLSSRFPDVLSYRIRFIFFKFRLKFLVILVINFGRKSFKCWDA